MHTVDMFEVKSYHEAPDFYQVREDGAILNTKGYVLTQQYGTRISYVTLRINGRTVTRSVAKMVSETFVVREKPWDDPSIFNTPIHLDGNRINCGAWNLKWRPRNFAIEYHRQFLNDGFDNNVCPIEVMETGRIFKTVRDFCMYYGVLNTTVLQTLRGIYLHVWPTLITPRLRPDLIKIK